MPIDEPTEKIPYATKRTSHPPKMTATTTTMAVTDASTEEEKDPDATSMMTEESRWSRPIYHTTEMAGAMTTTDLQEDKAETDHRLIKSVNGGLDSHETTPEPPAR